MHVTILTAVTVMTAIYLRYVYNLGVYAFQSWNHPSVYVRILVRYGWFLVCITSSLGWLDVILNG